MRPTLAILLSTLLFVPPAWSLERVDTSDGSIAQIADSEPLSPQAVRQTAQRITVRITANNSGGSGVLIAKKGNSYLILTNAHVTRRGSKFEIQTPDGQKHTAKPIDGGFDAKYDLALLEFTSQKQYTLANLSTTSPLDAERTIYSAGFPFDSREIRITSGQVSQLSDIPFDNGTQIGYTTSKGEKGLRQGMSGGAILDVRGVLLGINTIGSAPILPNYTYSDGSKPLAKLAAKYRSANWGVPVYNFLIKVKPDILYRYKFNGLAVGQIQPQANPTGYMAKLNDLARKQTVRIENSGGNGSGVIIAREGNSYYVVTAKHVLENEETQQRRTNNRLITYDQDTHNLTSTVLATGVDLAIVKFTSTNIYPIAQLSEISPNNKEIVLAGGFPGRDKINSPLWQWQLNPGNIFEREIGKFETQDRKSFSNGYDLIYTSISYGGMSGGGVFDTAGRVIGIHGRAEQTEGVMLGKSQGISIQTLIGLAPRLQLNPKLLKLAKNPAPALTTRDLQTIYMVVNLAPPTSEDSGERWLTYGNQLYRIGQLEKSVTAFDMAIDRGQILTGNYGKALSLRFLVKPDLASVAIAKAIAAVPTSKRANYYYFWKHQSGIFILQQQYGKALVSIDTAIKLEPQDRTLLYDKALILVLQKQHAAAIKVYDDLIGDREDSYAYEGRGIAKLSGKDYQGAIADLDRAIKINPNLSNAYNGRGSAKLAVGDNQGAIADFDRVIKINPNYAETYVSRGTAKLNQGEKKEAIADLDRAIQINPNSADAYMHRGTAKSDLGDNKGANADYDRAVKINPNYDAAYFFRGTAKLNQGEKKGAIADFDRAITINPNYAEVYIFRGTVKSDLGDKKGAIADFDRAIQINPNYAEAYGSRGLTKLAWGDKQGAIADLSKGAELSRQQGRMDSYQRTMKLIAQLKGEGTIADLDRAIKINPNDAIAYVEKGLAKYNQGDKQGAIADYDRAIKINPNFADAYSNRGLAKSALGDKQGAIADYDRAIKITPKDAAAYISQAAAYIGRGGIKLELGDKQGAIADLSKGAELLRQQGQMDYYQQVMDTIAQLKGR
ncbi:tetratricopeptide repeat protein [Chamaesiphon sp. OTE_8_metabat_110]|uniref:tetratricopeptide repeat protein n=1 Tax=Chamaesiphon sp. OTE_8_metabat_110 TaxID=2964696 RepID=UPI00286A0E5D|nr:tetratricopeptide repeat protein [Chamaesiphon sp. OTE_8_metabat_110]